MTLSYLPCRAYIQIASDTLDTDGAAQVHASERATQDCFLFGWNRKYTRAIRNEIPCMWRLAFRGCDQGHGLEKQEGHDNSPCS